MPGNAQKIVDAARRAYAQGARLVLTPELSICGYAAEDLFLRPAFIAACDDAVKTVARELAGLKGLHVVVGHPSAATCAASRCRCSGAERGQRAEGRAGAGDLCQARAAQLPGVRRAPLLHAGPGHLRVPGRGHQRRPADLRGRLVRRAGRAGREAGAELLAVINASPFHVGKAASAWRAWPTARGRAGCRWSTPTWWAGRTRWCSTALRSRCRRRVLAGARPLPRGPVQRQADRTGEGGVTLASTLPAARAAEATCGTRWCWACATTSARTAFPACCWGCRAASTPPWCWPSPSTRWARTRCGR
jgi:hypothetical protein